MTNIKINVNDCDIIVIDKCVTKMSFDPGRLSDSENPSENPY